MTWSLGAMLGSTVDLGSATVLGFWTNYTFSPLTWTWIAAFFLHCHAEWRSMLSRCFDLSPCTRCSPLEYGQYCYEPMCWNLLDDERHFSRSVRIFRTLPLRVESLVVMPINLDDLWLFTSHFRARLQTTHNNNTQQHTTKHNKRTTNTHNTQHTQHTQQTQHTTNTTTTHTITTHNTQHHHSTITPPQHHPNTTTTPQQPHNNPTTTTTTTTKLFDARLPVFCELLSNLSG